MYSAILPPPFLKRLNNADRQFDILHAYAVRKLLFNEIPILMFGIVQINHHSDTVQLVILIDIEFCVWQFRFIRPRAIPAGAP